MIEMKDFFRYTDKVCVVTGSSNGMGLATARMLVELGARVYALSRSETKVDGLTASILCDLTKKDDIDRAFAQLPEHIDCFFGIAGLSGAKTDYVTTFNCDFTANKYITLKYLVNRMDAGSSITYVASTAGQAWQVFMGEQNEVVHAEGWEGTVAALGDIPELAPSNFAYMFAKRCICQFAAEQAVELGKRGIRVNTVMPGSTQSGMKDEFEMLAGGKEALLAETGAAHRLASPEEMAGPIVFLGSELCSFVSGVDFAVDFADTAMKRLGLKEERTNIPMTDRDMLRMIRAAMNG